MIAHFPDPYPEEIFYSVCARFSDRLNIRGFMDTSEALFGNAYAATEIEWPGNLAALLERLPPTFPYTVGDILQEHSNLTLYAPFVPLEQYEKVLRIVLAGGSRAIAPLLGVIRYRSRNGTALKYCAECAQEDRRKWGETFWHRVHQAPGVIVCRVHRRFLHIARQFQPLRYDPMERFAYYSTKTECKGQPAIPFSGSRSQKTLLLQIAEDVDWLLSRTGAGPGPIKLAERYRLELISQKLAAPVSQNVYGAALHEAFCSKFPFPLLSALGVQLDLTGQNDWLMRLTHNWERAQIPLRHILMIRFLGHSAEDFFEALGKHHMPKAQLGYLCLNPVCRSFSKSVIPNFTLKKKQPRAVFRCPLCGFTYARHLPLRTNDEERPSSVVEFGSRWISELRRMWNIPKLTLTAIAKNLGVAQGVVKKYGFRLNLRFPRTGMRTGNVPEHFAVKHDRRRGIEQTRRKHRGKWMLLRRARPNSSRSQLAQLASTVYAWLRLYDKAWLNCHKPRLRRKLGYVGRDWEKLDRQLLRGVQQTGKRLLASFCSDFPTPITARKIAKETKDFDPRFLPQLSKLPKTADAIAELADTTESLVIRRTKWANSQNSLPNGWSASQLKHRLGLWDSRQRAKISRPLFEALTKAAQGLIARSP